MKKFFPGHFRPSDQEIENFWKSADFVFDANVLLNLYRYSKATRKELQDAITSLNGRVFITHQAASEFLKNRLSVTSDQAKEYENTSNTIKGLVQKISSKDRHPFIDEKTLGELKKLTEIILNELDQNNKSLLDKLSKDEILDFVGKSFDKKTGAPYDQNKLSEICALGKVRYESKIPPGFKDANKGSSDDSPRKYGDLIVWLQTIDYARQNKKSVIFVTDDKKEDWWAEESGRTIGPRPELIEEFQDKANQKIWMYSVEKFIAYSAGRNSKVVNPDVFEEIRKVSEQNVEQSQLAGNLQSSIRVQQETTISGNSANSGVFIITLERQMKYATGSGKFKPPLTNIPQLIVDLIYCPAGARENISFSFGCGTIKDFNIHIKGLRGALPAGDYIFDYTASVSNAGESN